MVTYADTFDRDDTTEATPTTTLSPSVGLGSTSTGSKPWAIVAGGWRINGRRALSNYAQGTNPVATIELPGSDGDASCTGSGGAAIYARVKNKDNWLRARVDYYSQTTSYTYQSGTRTVGRRDVQYYTSDGTPVYGPYYETQEPVYSTGYSTSYYYVTVLESCVAGSISEIARTSAASSQARVRLKVANASAQIFYGSTTTVATLPASTVSALEGVNRHGIGLGPSTIQENFVDDYSVEVLNTAPGAPTTTAPASGASVPTGQPIRHSWSYTDPDVGDTQKAFEVQYRVAGTTNWTSVRQNTSNLYWDAPDGLLSGTIEWRVRVTDTADATSPFSATSVYSIGTSAPGDGGASSGGGGGTGMTPVALITLVQVAELRRQVDALTEMVMEAQ